MRGENFPVGASTREELMRYIESVAHGRNTASEPSRLLGEPFKAGID
jgi:hypothetical protein